ncbi:hypothetical protein BB560_004218 [Smittium megazygosporum]|uniref:Uncharacterized protein n=1 Tax=Smittium megazygosporum TaxID=133381 RepID=A0A2T9ZA09_9FUNG|nr:hypothetical protein BB560_004218 [Smittium megazygosporum]
MGIVAQTFNEKQFPQFEDRPWNAFNNKFTRDLEVINHHIENNTLCIEKHNKFLKLFYTKLLILLKDKKVLNSHRKEAIELSQRVFITNEKWLHTKTNLWVLEEHFSCMSLLRCTMGIKYVYTWMSDTNYINSPRILNLLIRGIIKSQTYDLKNKIVTDFSSPILNETSPSNPPTSAKYSNKFNILISRISKKALSYIYPLSRPAENNLFSSLTVANTYVQSLFRRRKFALASRFAFIFVFALVIFKVSIFSAEAVASNVGGEYRQTALITGMVLYPSLAIALVPFFKKYNPEFSFNNYLPRVSNSSFKEHSNKFFPFTNSFFYSSHLPKVNLLSSLTHFDSSQILPSILLRVNSDSIIPKFSFNFYNSNNQNSSPFKNNSNPLNPRISQFQGNQTLANVLESPKKSLSKLFHLFKKTRSRFLSMFNIMETQIENFSDIKSDTARMLMVQISNNTKNCILADDLFVFLYNQNLPLLEKTTKLLQSMLNSQKSPGYNTIYCTFSDLYLFSKWVSINGSDIQFYKWSDLLLTQNQISIDGLPPNSDQNYLIISHLLYIMLYYSVQNPQLESKNASYARLNYIITQMVDCNKNKPVLITNDLVKTALYICNQYNLQTSSLKILEKFLGYFSSQPIEFQKIIIHSIPPSFIPDQIPEHSDTLNNDFDITNQVSEHNSVIIASSVLPFFQLLFNTFHNSNPIPSEFLIELSRAFNFETNDQSLKYFFSESVCIILASFLKNRLYGWKGHLFMIDQITQTVLNSKTSFTDSQIHFSGSSQEYNSSINRASFANKGETSLLSISLLLQALYPYTSVSFKSAINPANFSSNDFYKLSLSAYNQVIYILSDLSKSTSSIFLKYVDSYIPCFAQDYYFKIDDANKKHSAMFSNKLKEFDENLPSILNLTANVMNYCINLGELDLATELYFISNNLIMIYNVFAVAKQKNFGSQDSFVFLPGIFELSADKSIFYSYLNSLPSKRSYDSFGIHVQPGHELKDEENKMKTVIPHSFMKSTTNFFLTLSILGSKPGQKYFYTPKNPENVVKGKQALFFTLKMLEKFSLLYGFVPDEQILKGISNSRKRMKKPLGCPKKYQI